MRYVCAGPLWDCHSVGRTLAHFIPIFSSFFPTETCAENASSHWNVPPKLSAIYRRESSIDYIRYEMRFLAFVFHFDLFIFFAHFWLGFPFSLDADGLHWTGLDNSRPMRTGAIHQNYPQFSFWFVRNQLQYRCMCTLRTLEIGQVGTIRHPSMTMLNWKKQKNIWDMETRSLFISHSAIVSLYIRHSLHTQWSALLNSFIIKVMGMKEKNLIEK